MYPKTSSEPTYSSSESPLTSVMGLLHQALDVIQHSMSEPSGHKDNNIQQLPSFEVVQRRSVQPEV